MKYDLRMIITSAAVLLALAFVATTPAAASPNEYCRTEVTSGMRSCSFSTMEQCRATFSGRGGTCSRDSFLPESSSTYAYQPKRSHSKQLVEPVRKYRR